MYLSRLILNPRSRQVQSEINNPYEMHRTIMRAFPDAEQDSPGRVLFRLETLAQTRPDNLILLVQSENEPDWNWLEKDNDYLLPTPEQNPAYKPYQLTLVTGQRLAFRLRANPTIKRKFEGETKSKRVGLYGEEEQMDWLRRKAERGGFAILTALPVSEGMVTGRVRRSHQKDHPLKMLAVRFDGLLQVVTPDKFRTTVRQGIGSGKGLGFGLLSLAPG
jgi:CRISPR system Cascade subunit CasE